MKVQARVLRTIDKVGGLDEYLLGDKPARIKELGVEGWRLRWRILRTPRVKERFRAERVRLGLPAEGWKPSAPVEVEVSEGVQEEVERVSEDIVERMEADDAGSNENAILQDGDEFTKHQGQQDDMIAERFADAPGYAKGSQIANSGKQISSKNSKIPRLVGIRDVAAEEREPGPDTGNLEGQEKPEFVQADDSKTLAGRALGRMKGLFRQ